MPVNITFSIVANDLVVSPNTLRLPDGKLLINNQFWSEVSTLRFLATYQTPEDAFNTASFVKKKSTSELKRILKRNLYDAVVPFDWYNCFAILITAGLFASIS